MVHILKYLHKLFIQILAILDFQVMRGQFDFLL